MKIQHMLFSLVTASLLVWAAGCGNKETPSPDAAKPAANGAADAAGKTTEAVRETGTKAVGAVTEQAKEVAATASNKAQEIIDSARKLFSGGKYADALAKLKELSGEPLSPAQQSAVATLKAQIQKALGAALPAGTSAAGATEN